MTRFFQVVLLLFIFTVPSVSISQNTDFLLDERDGNVYLLAKFKHTWWMCQNMKYDIGDGSDCQNNDETNCMLQGRLYNQAAAMKVCPEGYHLPSDDDWKALESYLGINDIDLDKAQIRTSGEVGKYLRAGGGIGFDAEMVGMMSPAGKSIKAGTQAYFWSSSQEGTNGWARIISMNHDGVDRKLIDAEHMLSVRCIKYGVEEADVDVQEEEKPVASPEVKPEARPQNKQENRNRQGQERPKTRPAKREKGGKEGSGGN